MTKKRIWTIAGLLLTLLSGALICTACKTPPPPPLPRQYPPPLPSPGLPYFPITWGIIDEINNPDNSVIINNTKSLIRLEELQYYISKDIVLERRETKPVLEINARGELIRWDLTTAERLSLRRRTPGVLCFYGSNEDEPMIMSICFDDDERLTLEFKQDPARENRFYLLYDDCDGVKKVNYGETKQYFLSFSDRPPVADKSEGGSSGTDTEDPRPYLQILSWGSRSVPNPINRTIDGRRVGN
jgi:hypothetical protein